MGKCILRTVQKPVLTACPHKLIGWEGKTETQTLGEQRGRGETLSHSSEQLQFKMYELFSSGMFHWIFSIIVYHKSETADKEELLYLKIKIYRLYENYGRNIVDEFLTIEDTDMYIMLYWALLTTLWEQEKNQKAKGEISFRISFSPKVAGIYRKPMYIAWHNCPRCIFLTGRKQTLFK